MLKCAIPRDELWAGLRDKTKNVIRRARERLAIREITSPKYFVKYYQANLGGAKSYFDLSRLEAVHVMCQLPIERKVFDDQIYTILLKFSAFGVVYLVARYRFILFAFIR